MATLLRQPANHVNTQPLLSTCLYSVCLGNQARGHPPLLPHIYTDSSQRGHLTGCLTIPNVRNMIPEGRFPLWSLPSFFQFCVPLRLL